MIDFFKLKIDIKNKIQSFIDKLESAHEVKNTIQQFVKIREEEEQKNSPVSNNIIEEEKEKVCNILKHWSNMTGLGQPILNNNQLLNNIIEQKLVESLTFNESKIVPESIETTAINNDDKGYNCVNERPQTNRSTSALKRTPIKEILRKKGIENLQRKHTFIPSNNNVIIKPRIPKKLLSKNRIQSFKEENSFTQQNPAGLNLNISSNNIVQDHNSEIKRPSASFIIDDKDVSQLDFDCEELTMNIESDSIQLQNLKVRNGNRPKEISFNKKNTYSKLPLIKSSAAISKEEKTEPSVSTEIQNASTSSTNIAQESIFSKDIDKIAEYHENILDEELEEDENEIDLNRENRMFEHLVKRHELLQEETRKEANHHNFKFTNTTYNTYMVGNNREGKCGNEVYETFAKHPALLRKHFEFIYCGYHHTAALDENGFMYTWGRNNNGQLGQGEVQNQAIPNLLARPLTYVEISEVSCGWQNTMAVASFGFLYTWGLNSNGQFRHGDY